MTVQGRLTRRRAQARACLHIPMSSDNPLLEDSDDSSIDMEDGGNPLANSSDSEDNSQSDEDHGENAPAGGISDDLLADLMPTSKIGLDVSSDSDDSDEGAPMTAAEIQAMRASGVGRTETQSNAQRDYLTEIGESGRVPMMFGTSAGGSSVRIDWQNIGKDDVKLFTDLFHKHVDGPSQFNRSTPNTAAWLLQHALTSCLELMLKLARAEDASAGTVVSLEKLLAKAQHDGLAVSHIATKKIDFQPVQPAFCDLTDAVNDISKELRARSGPGNLHRINELVEGLDAWLDGGADPTELQTWSGLMQRSTWAPTLQLKDQVLYVEDMEFKKRRKKHASSEIFERGQHRQSQVTQQSHDTRAWLLAHALRLHLGALDEAVPAGGAAAQVIAATKAAVDDHVIALALGTPGEAEYGYELVDCLHDLSCEFKARSSRLAKTHALGEADMDRIHLMASEVTQWLHSGALAAATDRDGHASPWRQSEGYIHDDQLSKRWNTVYAEDRMVHQLLDIFDEDDVETLQSKVMNGLPADIVVDPCGESALMAAAARNAFKCAEWLIEKGATVNAVNDDGSTAFHYACAFGSLHCIAVLLKANCSTSAADNEGYTGFKLADGEPWDDLLDVMATLADNRQWGELDVLIDDQSRVKSLEEMVEAEAERRRPHLDYQALPPSRWLAHHVLRWIQDAFSWAPDYIAFLETANVDGELLVKCDKSELAEKCGIKVEAHQTDVLAALGEQDLWGWE
eukprot:SAG31_NODE_160_length_21908_cov_25.529048_3_plen_740_part_00